MKDKYGESTANQLVADGDLSDNSSTSESEDDDGEVSLQIRVSIEFSLNVLSKNNLYFCSRLGILMLKSSSFKHWLL